MKEAVFLNGLNGHAFDFDDGTNTGIIHLGVACFFLFYFLWHNDIKISSRKF